MTIHERIKRARIAKGLSMEQLAAALGLKSWQSIQQWENGTTAPRRQRMEQLAKVLDMDEVELVTGKDVTPSWPFERLSEEKVKGLSHTDLIRLETALMIVAADLGIDIENRKKTAA